MYNFGCYVTLLLEHIVTAGKLIFCMGKLLLSIDRMIGLFINLSINGVMTITEKANPAPIAMSHNNLKNTEMYDF